MQRPVPDDDAANGFAGAQEAYISGYIQFADAKALAIFAWASAVFGFLISDAQFLTSIRSLPCSLDRLVAVCCALSLVAACALSAFVVAPRLWTGQRGVVYWGAIAKFESSAQYLQAVANASPAELEESRLSNTFNLARICDRKYHLLRLAVWATFSGFAFAAAWKLLAA